MDGVVDPVDAGDRVAVGADLKTDVESDAVVEPKTDVGPDAVSVNVVEPDVGVGPDAVYVDVVEPDVGVGPDADTGPTYAQLRAANTQAWQALFGPSPSFEAVVKQIQDDTTVRQAYDALLVRTLEAEKVAFAEFMASEEGRTLAASSSWQHALTRQGKVRLYALWQDATCALDAELLQEPAGGVVCECYPPAVYLHNAPGVAFEAVRV